MTTFLLAVFSKRIVITLFVANVTLPSCCTSINTVTCIFFTDTYVFAVNTASFVAVPSKCTRRTTFRAFDSPISNITTFNTASVYMVTGFVIKAMAAWCATVNTEKSIVTFLFAVVSSVAWFTSFKTSSSFKMTGFIV